MLSRDNLDSSAELLRVLGHAVRLELVVTLVDGEHSVGEIDSRTGIGQPGLSQQLAVLRKADLVTARREAKQVFYSLNRGPLERLGQFFAAISGSRDQREAAGDPLLDTGGAAVFARVTPRG
ncbi:MAG: winged helix-turn-helix transcriptional regulator [Sphingomonadales bacterium]|nr:winged helix-turn-helix transcriptional regulator [Sphingomonadales bacterium]MDE2567321.1 winged helix-turn-helix transcriptional regulator [Sphingomonadales bacterium]